MDIQIVPGKYIVAVSGGVDSMVLLDLLLEQPDLKLVVAHFDHGIRTDSTEDREFVGRTVAGYGLPYEYREGKLGSQASESQARTARYEFLRDVQKRYDAKAIITAHHQDDTIETAIINMLRGTGRKGLSSLQSTDDVVRPLLQISKKALLEYASSHKIAWREDSTNADDRYLRNYIRHTIVPKLGAEGRSQLLIHIAKAEETNLVIDELLIRDLEMHSSVDSLNRSWFMLLPHSVASETMAAWLRKNNIREFDKNSIERLVVLSKVAKPGKLTDINAGYLLEVDKTTLKLLHRSIV